MDRLIPAGLSLSAAASVSLNACSLGSSSMSSFQSAVGDEADHCFGDLGNDS